MKTEKQKREFIAGMYADVMRSAASEIDETIREAQGGLMSKAYADTHDLVLVVGHTKFGELLNNVPALMETISEHRARISLRDLFDSDEDLTERLARFIDEAFDSEEVVLPLLATAFLEERPEHVQRLAVEARREEQAERIAERIAEIEETLGV